MMYILCCPEIRTGTPCQRGFHVSNKHRFCFFHLHIVFFSLSLLGLRTLCIAYRRLDRDYYKEWAKQYYRSSIAVTNRAALLAEVCDEIEQVDLLAIANIRLFLRIVTLANQAWINSHKLVCGYMGQFSLLMSCIVIFFNLRLFQIQ